MIEEILTRIPKAKLKKDSWYLSRGRNSNIGYWNGKYFLTMGFTFENPRIKSEPYYETRSGCFQPFKIIQEGEIALPYRTNKTKPYGKILKLVTGEKN